MSIMPFTDVMKKQMNDFGNAGIPFLCIIDFSMEHPLIFPLSEINANELLYNFNGASNYVMDNKTETDFSLEKLPPSFEEYKQKFDAVANNIHAGNTYLLNLTCATQVKMSCSLRDICIMSSAKYSLCYKDEFVVFSPEIFVQIRDGVIASYPMKGTIDASIINAREKILNDPKEVAEHYTIVDLIRNDLSMVAKDVKVDTFRYIDTIKTNNKELLQVSSKIAGLLPADYLAHLGDIIFTLLPAGSVTGAPKKKTVEIILETENFNRGYYTGVAGVFDGKNFDSCVMIRYIEKNNNDYVFKSGGGITSFSDPVSEYNEMIDKVYLPIEKSKQW